MMSRQKTELARQIQHFSHQPHSCPHHQQVSPFIRTIPASTSPIAPSHHPVRAPVPEQNPNPTARKMHRMTFTRPRK